MLVAAVQFANVLDFMMVMPLGPDFSEALDISPSRIGVVGGVYTASAAVSGILGSLFLDRFDRRRALAVAMLGLAVATAAGGLATGLWSLLGARTLAGAFGGPATSLALAIVTDSVPTERRGKALGSVMAAFSLASIFGVPIGLELAHRFGFRAPFFAVAGLGLLITGSALRIMPPMQSHLVTSPTPNSPPRFGKLAVISLLNTACVMVGVFAIVPNISTYIQYNLDFPREDLGLIYLVGGVASYMAMRLAGVLVDRWGALPLVIVGTALHVSSLYLAFLQPTLLLPVVVIFALFMLSGSVRMVPMQTLATQVPGPNDRARFMSVQSAVQHIASSAGAFASSLLLVAEPTGQLRGMETVAWGALVVALAVPFSVAWLVRGLQRRSTTWSRPTPQRT